MKNHNQIDTKELQIRLREFNRSNTITLFGIMKGITLSSFGYILLNNLIKYGFSINIIHILLLANLFAMILTYDSAFFGSLFSYSSSNWISTFSIFCLSCFEFLIIVILLPTKKDSYIQLIVVEQVNYWFLFYTFFNLSAALVQYNETRNLIQVKDFIGLELQKIVESYKKDDRKNLKMAFISGLCYLCITICCFAWFEKIGVFQYIMAVIAFIILLFAFIKHHVLRKKIINEIFELYSKSQ